MKLDSKWFDRIRIRPDGATRERHSEESLPECDAPGCDRRAPHRAPKGRQREGEYFRFCLEHVREYNRTYNWFEGMSDEDMAAWMRSRTTGHRPTWSVNSPGAGSHPRHTAHASARPEFFIDPFDLFTDPKGKESGQSAPRGRRIGNAERRSLDALGLDETATGADIKARYKELVKRHHPDANGGDRSKEGRLRQIIEAYTTLKATGFYRDC